MPALAIAVLALVPQNQSELVVMQQTAPRMPTRVLVLEMTIIMIVIKE